MRCPYQKLVISEKFSNRIITNTEFGECLYNECPFYYSTVTITDSGDKIICKACKKAESEGC